MIIAILTVEPTSLVSTIAYAFVIPPNLLISIYLYLRYGEIETKKEQN